MGEIVFAESAHVSASGSRCFPPVAADELGFALGVFVAAGSRPLPAGAMRCEELSEEETDEGEALFGDLLVHGSFADRSQELPHQASLPRAFAALWREYRDDAMRESLCARVLCFYFLMERTRGKVVEPWVTACPERPEEVLLDPVVVQGLAAMPVSAATGVREADLVAAILRQTRHSA
jgi:hypothetical protein